MKEMLVKMLILLLIREVNGIDIYRDEIISGGSSYQSYKFNVHHHLSGISPYFEYNSDGLNPSLPSGCEVDKSVYLIRHGSVYLDDYDYYHVIKPFLNRLNKSMKIKSSKLLFLLKWKSPFPTAKDEFEQLTPGGFLESYELGVQLSYRYWKMLSKGNSSSFRIWCSSSKRTKQTAKEILRGLFPQNESYGEMISISEDKTRGINTLTPTKTCRKFDPSKGSKEAKIWLNIYTKSIRKKFNSMIENFHFRPNDILAMQQLCGYETVTRGSSPFCHLFPADQWISFEYYFDIKYHYELGYGNDISPFLGIHWIYSIQNLLTKSTKQNLYLNIVHREMLPTVLVSLGLFNQSKDCLSLHHRSWKSSHFIPFLGRIQLEKLTCSTIDSNGSFIRILVNSKPIVLPECSQGPSFTCPIKDFIHLIDQRYQIYQNFSTICQTNSSNSFTLFQNEFI